jgi:hypothetical protein
MKNLFEVDQNGELGESGNILISNYTFMPSIDFRIKKEISEIESSPYADVIEFNEDHSDFHLHMDALKKYVKFYLKISFEGKEIENQNIRSDLVQCKREFFKNLDEVEIDDLKVDRRLCPDMEKVKD